MLTGCASLLGSDAAEELRSYEEIIEFPGISKNDLFTKTNAWFVDAFKSADSVIEYSDKEAGTVMGKWIYQYTEGVYSYAVRSTISVDVKDGKVRLIFKDPYFKVLSNSLSGTTYVGQEFVPQKKEAGVNRTRAEWMIMVEDFKNSVSKNTDW